MVRWPCHGATHLLGSELRVAAVWAHVIVAGRYASEGVFEKYLAEGEDGFDTIAWLAQQPWCDGQVATLGLSYGAHTQSALACMNPPALAAMFLDSGGFSSAYHSGIRQGGADAVLAASIFHYGEFTVGQAKALMAQQGIAVRQ